MPVRCCVKRRGAGHPSLFGCADRESDETRDRDTLHAVTVRSLHRLSDVLLWKARLLISLHVILTRPCKVQPVAADAARGVRGRTPDRGPYSFSLGLRLTVGHLREENT